MILYLNIFYEKQSMTNGVYTTPANPSILNIDDDGTWRSSVLDQCHIFILLILTIDMIINKIKIPFRHIAITILIVFIYMLMIYIYYITGFGDKNKYYPIY